MAYSAIGLKSPIGLQDTRNVLINGEFNLWQRGITSSIGFTGGGNIQNQYCADRWRYYAQTSGTGKGSTAPDVQISRVNFGLGEPSGAVNSSKYYLNIFFGHTADLAGAPFTAPAAGEPNGVTGMFAAGTGEGNFLALVQDIEDVNTLAGKSAILSFWAKSDFTSQVIIPRLKQYFGKDASIGSDSVNYIGTTGARHTIDNTWRQYKTEFNLSGVNGKVLGTSGDHGLQLSLFFHRCRGHGLGGGFAGTTMELANGAGVTGNISIAQVQLEQGTNATEFDTKHPSVENSLCQRYYQTCYGGWNGRGVASQTYGNTIQFSPEFNKTPACVAVTDIKTSSGFPVGTTADAQNHSLEGPNTRGCLISRQHTGGPNDAAYQALYEFEAEISVETADS